MASRHSSDERSCAERRRVITRATTVHHEASAIDQGGSLAIGVSPTSPAKEPTELWHGCSSFRRCRLVRSTRGRRLAIHRKNTRKVRARPGRGPLEAWGREGIDRGRARDHRSTSLTAAYQTSPIWSYPAMLGWTPSELNLVAVTKPVC